MKVNTVIIGGGISGLSAANFLSKKTSDFLILESSNRVGGTINSSEVDGYILENGPNTVLDNNTAIQELLSDLSITEELIYPDIKKISNRYLLINDRLEKIPLTIIEFLLTPILSIYSKIKIFSEILVPRHINDTDVESFIKRRFGKNHEQALEIYPASDEEEMVISSKRLLGDALFGAPSYFASKAMASRNEEIYFYHFTQKPSGKVGEVLGSFHAYEIGYVFGVAGLGPIENQELSRCMLSYWTNFSKTGNPNGSDIPNWELMNASEDCWYELGENIGKKEVNRLHIYSLINEMD